MLNHELLITSQNVRCKVIKFKLNNSFRNVIPLKQIECLIGSLKVKGKAWFNCHFFTTHLIYYFLYLLNQNFKTEAVRIKTVPQYTGIGKVTYYI